MVSAKHSAGTMFGGLAPFLDTKRKATICTNARVEICTSVKERDLWSSYRTTRDGLTKGLLVFANGRTIQPTEIVVTESPPPKFAGQWRLFCRAKIMKNLTSATWIKAKGILFLLSGLLSATLLFFAYPTLKTGLLIIIAVWSFCRFYYFAFYVIEHYVDPSYRFSGLLSVA